MKSSRKILIAIVGLFSLSGLLIGLNCGNEMYAVASTVLEATLLPCLLFEWCSAIYKEHNKHYHGLRLFAAVLAPIGLPVFLVSNYGILKGIAYSLLAAIAYIVLSIIYAIPIIVSKCDIPPI